ncbi:hypothetical protein PV328_012029 [Microctonus aethiopoides]|uniref:Uncharacterized protein n=1 Tax=Microctonus aethiopoides TaxID=144406 RepID=A0AA39C323_9HYME|nr:hypothetical protein PV328_012029 [Microctonus aethiopoides]
MTTNIYDYINTTPKRIKLSGRDVDNSLINDLNDDCLLDIFAWLSIVDIIQSEKVGKIICISPLTTVPQLCTNLVEMNMKTINSPSLIDIRTLGNNYKELKKIYLGQFHQELEKTRLYF